MLAPVNHIAGPPIYCGLMPRLPRHVTGTGLTTPATHLHHAVACLAPSRIVGCAIMSVRNTIAITIEMVLLIVVIRKRLGGLDDRRVALSALKTAFASIVMGLAVWGFLMLTATASVVVRAFGGMIVGAGVFFIAAWLLRSEELRGVLGMVRQRLRR